MSNLYDKQALAATVRQWQVTNEGAGKDISEIVASLETHGAGGLEQARVHQLHVIAKALQIRSSEMQVIIDAREGRSPEQGRH